MKKSPLGCEQWKVKTNHLVSRRESESKWENVDKLFAWIVLCLSVFIEVEFKTIFIDFKIILEFFEVPKGHYFKDGNAIIKIVGFVIANAWRNFFV